MKPFLFLLRRCSVLPVPFSHYYLLTIPSSSSSSSSSRRSFFFEPAGVRVQRACTAAAAAADQGDTDCRQQPQQSPAAASFHPSSYFFHSHHSPPFLLSFPSFISFVSSSQPPAFDPNCSLPLTVWQSCCKFQTPLFSSFFINPKSPTLLISLYTSSDSLIFSVFRRLRLLL
jgi:hypothetical protein